MPRVHPHCRISVCREEQGLSQAELARRAGMSRQLLNIIEHGKAAPSVFVAMQIADALGCAVGELFGDAEISDSLPVRLSESAAVGASVRLGKVGDDWVAISADLVEASGFAAADGRLLTRRGARAKAQPWISERRLCQNLFIAGCDPALGIVRDLWARKGSSGAVCWRNLSSSAALDALRRGEAHVAGFHFPEGNDGLAARAALPAGSTIVRFACWEQGWMIRRGNPSGFRAAEDLASRRFRLLNRPVGSGSRMLLDRLLQQAGVAPRKVPSYGDIAPTHADCAVAVAQGRADAAIGLRAVAAQHGLDFLSLERVAFDLLILDRDKCSEPVQRLLQMLQQRSLRAQLDGLPGYETRETGHEFRSSV